MNLTVWNTRVGDERQLIGNTLVPTVLPLGGWWLLGFDTGCIRASDGTVNSGAFVLSKCDS